MRKSKEYQITSIFAFTPKNVYDKSRPRQFLNAQKSHYVSYTEIDPHSLKINCTQFAIYFKKN